MSFQWTLIAGFLYAEIALIVIFLLTLSKPQIWRAIFNLSLVKLVAAQSTLFIYSLIGIMGLFFGESIREILKYTAKLQRNDAMYMSSAGYFEDQMRLFRGQRNFYISGFALFCLFIIKRLAGQMARDVRAHQN